MTITEQQPPHVQEVPGSILTLATTGNFGKRSACDDSYSCRLWHPRNIRLDLPRKNDPLAFCDKGFGRECIKPPNDNNSGQS